MGSTETSPGRCLHYCLCSTMEANKSILCFYLSALVPVLTNHSIKTLSRQYAEQPVTAAHITMSNFKTKPPVSVGMCRCQLPAQKKKPPENERLHFHQKRRIFTALLLRENHDFPS